MPLAPVPRLLIAASVGDGKSTLIRRLLCETGGVCSDPLDAIRDAAFAECLADGASECNIGLVLLDVGRGVLPQTRRHLYICWLMGIRRVIAAVNKMDAAGYSAQWFYKVRAQIEQATQSLEGIELTVLPVSALEGENVVSPPRRMPWYSGPHLLECLKTAEAPAMGAALPFRFPIQHAIRTEDFGGFAGCVLAGSIRAGEPVQVLPSGLETRVRRIVSPAGDLAEATAGQSVTLQLEDELDIGRGDMICAPAALPSVSRRFSANLVWVAETPLQICRPYLLKQTTRQFCAGVVGIRGRVNLESLALEPAHALGMNDIGAADFEVHRPLVFDPYARCRGTGSFVLMDLISNRTVAEGMILDDGQAASAPPAPTPSSGRAATIWLTGLSGAGKTTLAKAVQERLRAANLRVELLDGDIVRKHLSKGLGFGRADRDENICRIGFVADLLTRDQVVAIVAAISPYREARAVVRREIGRFLEVFVNAPLEVCEQRDHKGLYKLARAGGLPGFTGIDDPYEQPLNPEVECRTDRESVVESVEKILAALQCLR